MIEIVTRESGSDEWRADEVGSANSFRSAAEAERSIHALIAMGGEWAECEYGIRFADGRVRSEYAPEVGRP